MAAAGLSVDLILSAPNPKPRAPTSCDNDLEIARVAHAFIDVGPRREDVLEVARIPRKGQKQVGLACGGSGISGRPTGAETEQPRVAQKEEVSERPRGRR